VTALGHTSDRTVADMVADAECRTPTEAGARVVPKKSELLLRLAEKERRLDRERNRRVSLEGERLQSRRERLTQVLPNLVRVRTERLTRARADLARLSPIQQVARRADLLVERGRRLDAAATARLVRVRTLLTSRRAPDRIDRALAARFGSATRAVEHRRERLLALSPDSVLARGYSITQDATSGAVLRHAVEAQLGQDLRIRLASGRLGARVDKVEQ
jgi:exodeoxyribonuclease VII large subunit